MYAQIIAYEKGTKKVLDMAESHIPKTLVSSCNLQDSQQYEWTDFVVKIFDEKGEVSTKEITFGTPPRCRKPRPVVTADENYYDLEKYLKEVFSGKRELEADEASTSLNVNAKLAEKVNNISYTEGLEKKVRQKISTHPPVRGRSTTPGTVPGESWEETRRRQNRNKRKARRRALRKGKKAA